MKKTLLTLLVLSSSLATFSQGSWSPRTSLPDSDRGYAIGFSIGNYGYVGLGARQDISWEYFNDFWRFSPDSDTWTRMADFPGKGRVCPSTFVIGIYAYVVCGAQNNYGYDMVTECWQYNSLTNIWTQKHDFTGLSRYCAASFAIGGHGYLGTGYDTIPSATPVLRDFWEYDTATDTWTQKNNFGGISRYLALGFAVGGKGYICFGADSIHNNFSTAHDMWEYDTAADSWTQKSSNPTDSLAGASGFVIGNNIYVGTGETYFPVRAFNSFWQYNIITNNWTQQANFIGGKKGVCSAFAVGDTGYMGLGVYDSTFRGTNSLDRFIPSITTGINELSLDCTYISIYPNPTNGIFTIQSALICNHTSIDIYNVMSEKVYSASLLRTPKGADEINLSNQHSGMYIIYIKGDNQVFCKKLIINH